MFLEYLVDFDESIQVLYDWHNENAFKWKEKISYCPKIPQLTITIVDRYKMDENIQIKSQLLDNLRTNVGIKR